MKKMQERGVGKELPHTHLIQLASAILFLIIWILDSFVFQFSTFLAKYVPFVIRIALFLILETLAMVLIFYSGHTLFHKPEDPSKLVATGIFKHVRHPIYLGVFLIYIGFILITLSLISIPIWIIIIVLYDKMATFEERDLERIFGDEYVDYKKKVPKWIPKP
jgi:protein-S-isoprenylcysteine O-methyltransferase Ste14